MEVVLIALFVIAAVALFVSIPLRPGAKGEDERIEDPRRAELEARKEAARLGALIAATGDPQERSRLGRLRAEAELQYALLAERRRR